MDLPTLAGIEEAEARIRPHLPETPLVRSEILSRALGADVWLKLETVTPIASFKLRGALAAISRAREHGGIAAACTSSTGNHGQGVAYAARLLGLAADIFLPAAPNPVKRAMIEAFGGVTHAVGHDLDAAKAEAIAYAADAGTLFVDDGESLDLMEGAGTVGLEAARALPEIDAVFVPMGSGTLATGVATAVKGLQPGAKAIAVQAKGAPAMVESFHAGRAIERPAESTADGLICRVPAARALAGLLATVDDAMTCSDAQLLAGVRTLADCAHVLVEPAGAAGLAAAWAGRGALAGKRIVLVLTGANITEEQLAAALAQPPLFTLRQAMEA
ncbi:MAG: pyridoxal-phosphate dependent enzyme [Kiloniellales bacterium]|jgi:threonine dehydratase|nr:pyridoxal-phosphate dependent enzyme [Kiloniellales bacterium]